MNFIEKLENAKVAFQTLEIFWLGQAGFLIKTAFGKQIVIDPCFSDCVSRLNPAKGQGFKRIMPPVCSPWELELDILIISHEHNDHFDVDAIHELVKPKTAVYTNRVVADIMREMGFAREQIYPLKQGDCVQLDNCRILSVDCDHGNLAPEALGFLVDFGFVRIYYAGDTAWNRERLKIPLKVKPEVAILPINGAYGNLNAREAALYARELNCKICIPCHFWTFPLHRGDPQEFISEMAGQAPGCRMVMLSPGESCTIGIP